MGSGRPAKASCSGSFLPPAVLSTVSIGDPPDRVCRTPRNLWVVEHACLNRTLRDNSESRWYLLSCTFWLSGPLTIWSMMASGDGAHPRAAWTRGAYLICHCDMDSFSFHSLRWRRANVWKLQRATRRPRRAEARLTLALAASGPVFSCVCFKDGCGCGSHYFYWLKINCYWCFTLWHSQLSLWRWN